MLFKLVFVIVTHLATPAAVSNNSEIKCIHSYYTQNEPLMKVTSEKGLSWKEIDQLCNTMQPGYSLATQFESLKPEEMALCPKGSLVPIGKVNDGDSVIWSSTDINFNQTQSPCESLTLAIGQNANEEDIYCALNWPDLKPIVAAKDAKYNCGICQMATRFNVITQTVYPPHNNSIYAYDLELVSHDSVDDIGLVANGSDLTIRLLGDLAKAFEISVETLRWHRAKLNDDHKAVVNVFYDREGDKMDWHYYIHWNDENLDHKIIENFDITLIKLSTECVKDKKITNNMIDKFQSTGAIDVKVDLVNTTITSRECFWDEKLGAIWSQAIIWKINWKQCDIVYKSAMKIAVLSPEEFDKALHTIDILCAFNHKHLADWLNTSAEFDIKQLVIQTNFFISLHVREKSKASLGRLLFYSLPLSLAKLLIKTHLQIGNSTMLMHLSLFNILIAEGQTTNPVTGLALSLPCIENMNTTTLHQLNHNNMSMSFTSFHIVVTVSDSISFHSTRLAINTYGAHLDSADQLSLDSSLGSWMSFIQVSFSRDESYSLVDEDDYVDIAFTPVFRSPTLRGKCAERDFASDEWLEGNCRILKSSRDNMLVCRCQKMHQEPTLVSSSYIIYGFDASLSTYLASNKTLIIVIVFVCIMSALGLVSVILTAVLFPNWRKDQGHQIFLQMIAALTVNLFIGFFNNFSSIDAKSVACVAIGVVRHYSFLAMFFWMMILSSLQVKRLTTISGNKTVNHLVLKVSAIAWGLPFIPIIILLSLDVGYYRSVLSNRGYCYPEGIAFEATVQAPAGLILIANLFIFLIILNHIYGWIKCGQTIEVRKHTNDRAEQLRRLSTSIFIFFLFGFTWLFHFLSEEGIINSEFLFEFLFLITASFHLFMLSFFFILLDKNTRTLWKQAIGSMKMKQSNSTARQSIK